MDEKIKIAITKQDNESEKAENTGKKRVKRKKNKNWDDMAQSMQDFIISLKQNSDLFLPEDSYKKLEIYKIDDAQKAEWQKVMQSIYPKFYDVIGKDLIEKTLGTK